MDKLSLREFYLINNNGFKINILEGEYINQPTGILINIHGIGSHFQMIINDNKFDNFYSRDLYFKLLNIKSYALEFQGHGKSEGPKCLINNFQDLVDDINVLVNYLDQRYPTVKKFILAESMGGNIAIRYCIKYNNIAGLVLLSPMCGISSNIIPNYCLRKFLQPLSYIIPSLPLVAKSYAENGIKNKKYNMLKEKCIYNYNGYIKLATGRECLNAALSLPKMVKEFETPVIAFHDVNDTITNAYTTKLFIDNCSSKEKKFVPVQGSHHCLLLSNDDNSNNPAEIADQIFNWLAHII